MKPEAGSRGAIYRARNASGAINGAPTVIILAAGKGTRMNSELPKALHTLCGKPMLWHVLNNVRANNYSPLRKTIVVAGYDIEKVREFLRSEKFPVTVVHQKKQLGSGHAVAQVVGATGRSPLPRNFNGSVLELYCDTPLLSLETLQRLFKNHRDHKTDCSLLSVRLKNPFSYGRGLRHEDGSVQKIVEENDATPGQKALQEINVGCYFFHSKKLFSALESVRPSPVKGEVYLTDVVEILAKNGRVEAVLTEDTDEVMGINTPRDLAVCEEKMQNHLVQAWIDKGVKIRDPKSTTLDAGVKIGAGTLVLPHTVIEDTTLIGKNCVIGPFARIRGGSRVGDGSIIGNFVEVVRSTIGKKTQVKHLSYLGDAEVGNAVNIGAGTITANYDGKKKHKTIIRDQAQIGSGTVLVAPVTVGRGAKTGAGAVVTKGKNIPAGKVFAGVPARELL